MSDSREFLLVNTADRLPDYRFVYQWTERYDLIIHFSIIYCDAFNNILSLNQHIIFIISQSNHSDWLINIFHVLFHLFYVQGHEYYDIYRIYVDQYFIVILTNVCIYSKYLHVIYYYVYSVMYFYINNYNYNKYSNNLIGSATPCICNLIIFPKSILYYEATEPQCKYTGGSSLKGLLLLINLISYVYKSFNSNQALGILYIVFYTCVILLSYIYVQYIVCYKANNFITSYSNLLIMRLDIQLLFYYYSPVFLYFVETGSTLPLSCSFIPYIHVALDCSPDLLIVNYNIMNHKLYVHEWPFSIIYINVIMSMHMYMYCTNKQCQLRNYIQISNNYLFLCLLSDSTLQICLYMYICNSNILYGRIQSTYNCNTF